MTKLRTLAGISVLALGLAVILTALFGASLWDVAAVRAVQDGGGLKTPMEIISFLGDEQFFLLLVPLFFWCIDKAFGIDLGLLLLASAFLNGALKAFFKHPRPFWSDPKVRLSDAANFSLPSGHAQNAAVLGGYPTRAVIAAGRARGRIGGGRWAVVAVLVVLIVLVALSRVYLGVHFPGDVIWGAALGLALLALYVWLRPHAIAWLSGLSLGSHVLLAILAAALPIILNLIALAIPFGAGPAFASLYADAYSSTLADAANLGGMILGLWIGLALEVRYVRFAVGGPVWKRALRYLVGIVGLFAVWMGLRMIFPQEPLALGLALRVVRYGLTMLWAIVAWPWLFVRVGLAKRQG